MLPGAEAPDGGAAMRGPVYREVRVTSRIESTGAPADGTAHQAGGERSAPQPALPATALYAAVRSQIEHEDNLMTQRLNWLMAAQSFLFTAYAITLNAAPLAVQRAAGLQRQLRVLIPVVSAVICVMVEVMILAGVVALGRLGAWYATHGAGDRAVQMLPPIHGSRGLRLLGLSGPLLLPVVLAAVWVYLLGRGWE